MVHDRDSKLFVIVRLFGKPRSKGSVRARGKVADIMKECCNADGSPVRSNPTTKMLLESAKK
jgi:hypothetical protein